MLISFVIPVYNVEKYLKECVGSILEQGFTDYEIILVDDGSTDKSGFLCDEYSNKYKNIIVIHKENGGLSDARNVGIKASHGDYILFVDSDDYIGKNTLDNIVSSITKEIDVMFLNAMKVFPDGVTSPLGDGYDSRLINSATKKEVLKHIATLPKYPGSACTKLIRRKLIIENNHFFQKGLLSEDIDWTIGLLCIAEKFACCDVFYYYYRQGREGSITNTPGEQGIKCLCYIISKWASKSMKNEFQGEINGFVAYEYMIAILNYGYLEKKLRKKYRKFFRKYKWILQYGLTRRLKVVNICCNILGVDISSKLLMIKRKYL